MMLKFLSISIVFSFCIGQETPVTQIVPDDRATTVSESTSEPSPPNQGVVAQVTFVSDGDSLVVDINGTEERVRLIGINTPEKDECYGSEARDALIALIDGAEVLLVPDIEEFDQYGRILSYVYLDDLLINAEMARQGAALTRGYAPNTTLQSHLSTAQQQAEAAGSGLWGACMGDGDPEIVILLVNADAPGRDDENLNGEYVSMQNQSDTIIDLTGWILRDESSVHRYTFAEGFLLDPEEVVVVLTGCGNDFAGENYWCNSSPVWDNSGDTAFLLDRAGNIHDRFNY